VKPAAKKLGAVEHDAVLMRRLAPGNLSALGVFYDRHGDRVRHFVLRATCDPSLVDDITQDAFLALADAAPRYDATRPVRNFLVGIAGKLILRERRRMAITARVLNELKGWLGDADERTPETTAQAAEHLVRYDRALARLSEEKRVTVVMCDLEGMSGAEIAAALDIPVGSPFDCNGDGSVDGADLACILASGGPDALAGLLNATGLLPGDVDGSGDVGFPDFLVMSANFGSNVDSYADGDIDGSGSVAFPDFLVLSANFGQSSAATQSVPEPSSLVLFGFSMLGLFRMRRSRWNATTSNTVSSITSSNAPVSQSQCRLAIGLMTLLTVGLAFESAEAQTLTPVKQIAVSDNSDRDMIAADMDAGPLDDEGDIVARERRDITQDNIQIRTFVEFDLSSITAEAVANPNWSAKFLIDFVTRLNTANDMEVVVGRVLDSSHPATEEGLVAGDTWSTEAGSLPLFEWGRSGGESTDPEFVEDRLVIVENAKTDAFGTREIDVTSIVASWVDGTFENNGFSLAGGHDEFQGAGLANARLVVGIPGDFDGNGRVDFADFLILGANFASHLDGPVTAGDIDFDGDVDLDDFGQFKSVFASSAQAAAPQVSSVPEPAGALLAFMAMVGCLRLRSSRKSSQRS